MFLSHVDQGALDTQDSYSPLPITEYWRVGSLEHTLSSIFKFHERQGILNIFPGALPFYVTKETIFPGHLPDGIQIYI
jgi:hypothetical protein